MLNVRSSILSKYRHHDLSCFSSECATNTVQTFGEHFRIHTHADAKVIGHLEETAWDCRSIEIGSQLLQENINLSILQSHQ